MTVVKPSNACPPKYLTSDSTAMITAKMNMNPPATVTICNGTEEKAAIFVTAYFTRDQVDHLDSPASLG